jgi:ubiquinone/menaquinone biosynthesis C-methylase UbiE
MLHRVLEPEVMDSPEEARDYDAMSHDAVNRAFVEDFLGFWKGSNPILDLGTGTAQIPLALCVQAPSARVVGIDLAAEMLLFAEANVVRAGLEKQIRLERCDAKRLPHAAGSFGAVISNSIVHHIPEPAAVLSEMHRVLSPGGDLLARDLLRPPDDATVSSLVATYAGAANSHQKRMFEDSLRAALSLAEIRALVSDLGYDPAEVEQTTDRHWTWKTRKTA